MANELYYDYITEYLKIFKTTIDEAKLEVLPKIPNDISLSPQAEIIKYIDEVILDSDIDTFSENMNYYLTIREEVIKNYTEKRVKQISQNNPELKHNKYLVVGSKKKSTNEIFEKAMVVDSFKKESTITHLINAHSKQLLPEYTDISDIELTYAVNLSTFHDPNILLKSGKLATLEDPLTYLNKKPEYIIISRVKKSKRELEKFIDYLIGTREEFHYDSIATHEIVPKGKTFYDAVEDINKISDTTPFKIDYRPNEILLPFYKRENLNDIIVEGDKLAEKILKTQKEIMPEEKKKLLAGMWIDHHFNKMRIETILQIPEFFEWYKGVLGHNAHYHKERNKKRSEEHKNMKFQVYKDKSSHENNIVLNYNLNEVAKHLEERFSKVYELETQL